MNVDQSEPGTLEVAGSVRSSIRARRKQGQPALTEPATQAVEADEPATLAVAGSVRRQARAARRGEEATPSPQEEAHEAASEVVAGDDASHDSSNAVTASARRRRRLTAGVADASTPSALEASEAAPATPTRADAAAAESLGSAAAAASQSSKRREARRQALAGEDEDGRPASHGDDELAGTVAAAATGATTIGAVAAAAAPAPAPVGSAASAATAANSADIRRIRPQRSQAAAADGAALLADGAAGADAGGQFGTESEGSTARDVPAYGAASSGSGGAAVGGGTGDSQGTPREAPPRRSLGRFGSAARSFRLPLRRSQSAGAGGALLAASGAGGDGGGEFDLGELLRQCPDVADNMEQTLRESVISLTLHRTEELPHDSRIAHPVLCASFIDGRTGELLKKSAPDRPGLTAYESVEHLLPVMTKPFSMRGAAMRLPVWEEEIIVSESFAHILQPHVLVFFELMDFAAGAGSGWQRLAWCFFRPLSSSPARGTTNRTAAPLPNALRPMPLQLQLYRWQPKLKPPAGAQQVWAQYLAVVRKPYSSCVYFSLRAAPPPPPLAVSYPFRPMAAHHVEQGRLSYQELLRSTSLPASAGGDGAGVLGPLSSRRTARDGPCLLPNAVGHAFLAGEMGSTAAAFSPDGSSVAFALANGSRSLLAVFRTLRGTQQLLVHSHHQVVHELDWSPDGGRILTVSSDGTARLWDAQLPSEGEAEVITASEPVATLTHPAAVYSGRFKPKPPVPSAGGSALERARAASSRRLSTSRGGATSGVSGLLLVTGAADGSLRLWEGEGGALLATRQSHQQRVNAAVWSADGGRLFSADTGGVIATWEVGTGVSGFGVELRCVQVIEKKELLGVAVNSLSLHPSKRRMLVHMRSGTLVALDTRLLHFASRYTGHSCTKYNIKACYSPDGQFVIAGSEDGGLYVWAEESGELLVDGLGVGFNGPLLQPVWSSTDHLVALCGYGAGCPALLYAHDPAKAPKSGDDTAVPPAAFGTVSTPRPSRATTLALANRSSSALRESTAASDITGIASRTGRSPGQLRIASRTSVGSSPPSRLRAQEVASLMSPSSSRGGDQQSQAAATARSELGRSSKPQLAALDVPSGGGASLQAVEVGRTPADEEVDEQQTPVAETATESTVASGSGVVQRTRRRRSAASTEP